MSLPESQRAIIVRALDQPPKVEDISVPAAAPGSAVIQVLAANVLSYAREIYNGKRGYPCEASVPIYCQRIDLHANMRATVPTPLVIGGSAVGRIAAIGPDATRLAVGQLVFFDTCIRGRDDRGNVMLSGITQGFSAGSTKLMEGFWRDGSYAEYARCPLENLYTLNEQKLGSMGYGLEHLVYLGRLAVPMGGLRAIDVKAGETIIVAPATGAFGGAAVQVASALGAKVIAMGRNEEALKKLKETYERVDTVRMSGDIGKEMEALGKFGPIDALFDISSPLAAKSTHMKSCINVLREGGRITMMGGVMDDIEIPYPTVMAKSLMLKGKFMYDRQDLEDLIRMVECGLVDLSEKAGVKIVGKFKFEESDEAMTTAEKRDKLGEQVVLVP